MTNLFHPAQRDFLMSNTLEKLQSWGLILLIFLVPVFFLTLTPEFFDFNKLALLVAGTILLLAVWALRVVFENKLSFITTPFDLAVVLVAAAFILSTILQTTNKVDAFLMTGPTAIILACTLLYFVITQTLRNNPSASRFTLYALLLSGLVVALVSITAGTGILEKIPQLPIFMKQKLFSLAGAPLPTATFLLVLIPLLVGKIREFRKEPLLITYHLSLITIVVIALIIITPNLFPINKLDKPTGLKILPFSSGWTIAVETLKQSPFGVGPGNFISAFSQYRPISFNQTEVWSLRFASSSNWYLQVFTEVGVVGLVAVLFLVWKIVRSMKQESGIKGNYSIIHNSLFLILILFLLLPANLLLLIVFYLILGMTGTQFGREVKLNLTNGGEGLPVGKAGRNIVPWFALVVIVGGALPVFILGSRAYAAEMNFKLALDAAARGDGKTLYDQLIATIEKNPRVDRYRIAYAQTNLAIANSLAQKKDISDTERNTISQLVQQAIREGQAAVALNRALSINWEVLGAIYRSLIPFAQGSDQFAVAAYSQAIALEPVNPFLRIALGGVHYGAGRMDEAVKTFELAAATKPDLANAHYNLSAALREKGDISRAVQEIEQVLSLVQPNTQDYETAQQELSNLKSKLPASPAGGLKESTASGETLQAPQPTPAPVIRPPLELPPEAAPLIEPSPSPSPNPTP